MRLSILYSGGRGIGGCDDSTVEGEGLEDVMRLFILYSGGRGIVEDCSHCWWEKQWRERD